MVDFSKKIGEKSTVRLVDPIQLYGTLDRASDKGPLRPAQTRILTAWHSIHRSKTDLILKLHTGQGKTLIGLLMLQSKLNEGVGPALYLCPNKILVEQTVEQAKQFGIRCTTTTGDLPGEFLECRAILVTTAQKLFNGLSKFGFGSRSIPVGTLLIDDAHACVDKIRESSMILLSHDQPNESNAYSELLRLFEDDLRSQGDGTFEDILGNDPDAYLPIPYWAWAEKSSEVAKILSRFNEIDAIKFAWPLVRDTLQHTLCLASGTNIMITPYLAPLEKFGSFSRAKHRIYMSASVINDAFLIKGLRLSTDAVRNPLVDPEETWSGEKMVLIPSLIDETLDRSAIVSEFAPKDESRKYGVVGIVPSQLRSRDWAKYGASVENKNTLKSALVRLRERTYETTTLLVNYYDGIDLPDSMCRVLIIDSKPFSEELGEKYIEDRCEGSTAVADRIARIVEQGMGRAVRGEKDYCVIILIGPDLVRALQAPGQREYFSAQTRSQIDIGREIAEFAKDEIQSGVEPVAALRGLIRQCVNRDGGWKNWYVDEMDARIGSESAPRKDLTNILSAELAAEQLYQSGKPQQAAQQLQGFLDAHDFADSERGWYLQELARYRFSFSKTQANETQLSAHKVNPYLLRPKEGMVVTKVKALTPAKRIERIKSWLEKQETFENVLVEVDAIVSRLVFGTRADTFEQAVYELGHLLGFESDRPEKFWGAGPDNLWGLRADQHLLIECKSEVDVKRAEIHKREADQMNRSSSWFGRTYPGAQVTRVIIIPPRKVGLEAAFSDDVLHLGKTHLNKLVKNVRSFFNEFRTTDLRDLSETKIETFLRVNELTVEDICSRYCQSLSSHGRARPSK